MKQGLTRNAQMDLAYTFVVGYEGQEECQKCWLFFGSECGAIMGAVEADQCPALPQELQPQEKNGCIRGGSY